MAGRSTRDTAAAGAIDETLGVGGAGGAEVMSLGREGSTGGSHDEIDSATYDAAGNLVSQTDGEGGTTRATFDGTGHRVLSQDADGNATTYAYDAAGNLLAQTAPSSDPSYASVVTSYTCDAFGNKLSETDGANVQARSGGTKRGRCRLRRRRRSRISPHARA